MDDLVKRAEQNIINICKRFEDFYRVIECMEHFGHAYIDDPRHKDNFWEGINMMKDSINAQHAEHCRRALTFAAIGGDESKEYSLQLLEDAFGTRDGMRSTVMHFLDEYGRRPSSWRVDDEELFRKQVKDKLENNDG